jgi:hypothetical protein
MRNLSLAAAILSGAMTAPGENSFFPNESTLTGLIGLLLLIAPKSYYWVSVITSRWGSSLWGPITTHAILTVPMWCLAALSLRYYMVCNTYPICFFLTDNISQDQSIKQTTTFRYGSSTARLELCSRCRAYLLAEDQV